MHILELRKLAGREEIDYQFLLSALQNYSSPRDKISQWLKSGDLIRVKKGLYVFGPKASQGFYSKELLANVIYGPSSISLSYALGYYGLIPERVEILTCITNKRNKKFSTPIGNFIYYYLNPQKYSIGIELRKTGMGQNFLMASPEKALCDQIHIIDKKIPIHSTSEMEAYLFQDLRIDEVSLREFNKKNMLSIRNAYEDVRLDFLVQFLKKRNK